MKRHKNHLFEFVSHFLSLMSYVFPAYLPAAVVFLIIPFAIYLPNQQYVDYNLSFILPYLILAALSFVFLASFLFFLKPDLRIRFALASFYFGIFLALSDLFSLTQFGEHVAERSQWTLSYRLALIEVAAAFTVIFCAVTLPRTPVKKFGALFVFLLLILQSIFVFSTLSPESSFYHDTFKSSPEPKTLTSGGNVYHIIFDKYSSRVFLDMLNGLDVTHKFDGFTYFANNRSNYLFTRASVPSFMTGTLYRSGSLKAWVEEWRAAGIIRNLYDAGYAVSMYAPNKSWRHEKASHIATYPQIWIRYHPLFLISFISDLWLVRVVPHLLEGQVYSGRKRVFLQLFLPPEIQGVENARILASVLSMRQLILDEASRPDHGQYVYAHIIAPHEPYIMNGDCVFSTHSNYSEQALCVTRLMTEFISKLKELERYHKATIILQSDTGEWRVGPNDPSEYSMSQEIEKQIEEVKLRGSSRSIENQTHSLLLIKPSLHFGTPFTVSDRPTQLLDVPATLYDILGLPFKSEMGKSAFAPDFPPDREIHTYLGYSQAGPRGTSKVFGKNLFKGEMNHFSYTHNKGWKVYPNIPVRWE